jgi:hypothetical protein
MLVAAVQAQGDSLYSRSPRFRHCFAICGSAYRCMSHHQVTVCDGYNAALAPLPAKVLGPSVPFIQLAAAKGAPCPLAPSLPVCALCQQRACRPLNPSCFAAALTMAGASSLQDTSLLLLIYGHRRWVLGTSTPVHSYFPHICI